jgi:hypothetical protein
MFGGKNNKSRIITLNSPRYSNFPESTIFPLVTPIFKLLPERPWVVFDLILPLKNMRACKVLK